MITSISKLLILIFFLSLLCKIGNSQSKKITKQNEDSLKIVLLMQQITSLGRKVDSLRINNKDVQSMQVKLAAVDAKDDGRYDALRLWLPIITSIIVILAVFNTWRIGSIAKTEAREAFEQNFKSICDKIEQEREKASKLLSEIESFHAASAAMTQNRGTIQNISEYDQKK